MNWLDLNFIYRKIYKSSWSTKLLPNSIKVVHFLSIVDWRTRYNCWLYPTDGMMIFSFKKLLFIKIGTCLIVESWFKTDIKYMEFVLILNNLQKLDNFYIISLMIRQDLEWLPITYLANQILPVIQLGWGVQGILISRERGL